MNVHIFEDWQRGTCTIMPSYNKARTKHKRRQVAIILNRYQELALFKAKLQRYLESSTTNGSYQVSLVNPIPNTSHPTHLDPRGSHHITAANLRFTHLSPKSYLAELLCPQLG